MKILVLSDRYPPFHEGGHELNCQHVTDALQDRGHSVTVLTTHFGLPAPSGDGHIERILHSLDLPSRGALDRRTRQVRSFFQARENYWMVHRAIEHLQPDLAFVWQMRATSILPVLAAQDAHVRTVFRIGSHWLVHLREAYVTDPNRLKRWYRSGLIGFRHFDKLAFGSAIMVSETLKQSYQQAGFDVAKAVVIPNGFPGDAIAQHPLRWPPHGAIRLLYAGRLEQEKGPAVAIRAVQHLINERGHQQIALDLVGKGEVAYVQELKEYIDSHALQGKINILGWMPQSELLSQYSKYDLLVFPTLCLEGFGMAIIEAMAQGLTVIASDIGGPRDIIENGQNGLLVAPNDSLALANAIEQVIKNPALAANIGACAIQTVRQKYSFQRMLDQYETLLTSLVRNTSAYMAYT
jgi:glycosyltransferase involved in cell wall biosynthesis